MDFFDFLSPTGVQPVKDPAGDWRARAGGIWSVHSPRVPQFLLFPVTFHVVLHGHSPSWLCLSWLPSPTSSDLEVIVASLCCFAWVPQHPSLVPLTPPNPLKYFFCNYTMQNARLDESQGGIKIAGKNINNLRYADDTTLMEESKDEPKSLLMRVKKKSKNLA